MNKNSKLLLLASITFTLLLPFGYAEEEDMSAAGYDKQRIEQEDKLWVPLEKADEVWKYLEDRLVKDTAYLTSLDPKFTSFWHLEEFWDTYYDTPSSFPLLNMQSGVRHRKRINHSDPDNRKSGRELMQIKLNNISGNELERGEIKYAIEYPTVIKTAEDKHPMLGIVKPSHREGFKKRLMDLKLDPYSMKPILTVHDYRSRIYILKDKKPFMSISMDKCDVPLLWAKYEFVEIEPELNEIGFTDADAQTRRYMETILDKVVNDIQTKFPFIQRNLTPKYGKAFYALEKQIPCFRQLIALNLHNDPTGLAIGALAVVGGVGFFGYIGFKRLTSKKKSKV